MSAIPSAISSLMTTLKRVTGITVTFHRGANSVSVTAIRGTSSLEGQDQYGVVQILTSQDFIVKASELILYGSQVTPKAGDRIKIAGSSTQVYEVLTPPYRPSSSDGAHIRIFTKFVGNE